MKFDDGSQMALVMKGSGSDAEYEVYMTKKGFMEAIKDPDTFCDGEVSVRAVSVLGRMPSYMTSDCDGYCVLMSDTDGSGAYVADSVASAAHILDELVALDGYRELRFDRALRRD